ncbi:MAG: hypothetical protein HZB22_08035 [Deltaproteobacteria bacterium]|nr:hypothetical protein [Deltaproteobacteria bacterium]
MFKTRDGSPFECSICTDRDKSARNCRNHKDLLDGAQAVRAYTDEVTRELGDKGAQKVFSLGDVRLYECPLSYLTEDTYCLMRLVFLIEDSGFLLYAGGWGEQPHWLVEAFEMYKVERALALRGGKN